MWAGANVNAAIPSVLTFGLASATFSGPAAGSGEGCEPFNANNARAVSGKVAFITPGVCTAATKTRHAQNAGAVAVMIGDTVAENAVQPIPLGDWDKTVNIASVRLFKTDADRLRTQLAARCSATS